jgi:hypothetical protein
MASGRIERHVAERMDPAVELNAQQLAAWPSKVVLAMFESVHSMSRSSWSIIRRRDRRGGRVAGDMETATL